VEPQIVEKAGSRNGRRVRVCIGMRAMIAEAIFVTGANPAAGTRIIPTGCRMLTTANESRSQRCPLS
jgi:hypothetical protein